MNSMKKASQILVIIGIIISAYLVVEHYNPSVLSCPNNTLINCSSVLTSQYSTLFGISLSIIALIWTVGMFILILKRDSKISKHIFPLWKIMGIIGVAYSLISQYLIGYICIYCTFLDIIITTIIIIELKLRR